MRHRWAPEPRLTAPILLALLVANLMATPAQAQQPHLALDAEGLLRPGEPVTLRFANDGDATASGNLEVTVRQDSDAVDMEPRFLLSEPEVTLAPGEARMVIWTPSADAPTGLYWLRVDLGDSWGLHAFDLKHPSEPPSGQPEPWLAATDDSRPIRTGIAFAGDGAPTLVREGPQFTGHNLRFSYAAGLLEDLQRTGPGDGQPLLERLETTPAPTGELRLHGSVLHHDGPAARIVLDDGPQGLLNLWLAPGSLAELHAPSGSSWNASGERTYTLQGPQPATLSIVDLVTREWTSPDGLATNHVQEPRTEGAPDATITAGTVLAIAARGQLAVTVLWTGGDQDSARLAQRIAAGELTTHVAASGDSASSVSFAAPASAPTPRKEGDAWVLPMAASARPQGLMSISIGASFADPLLDQAVRLLADGRPVSSVVSLDDLDAAYARGERTVWMRLIDGLYELIYADPGDDASEVRLERLDSSADNDSLAFDGRTIGLALGAAAIVFLSAVALARRKRN